MEGSVVSRAGVRHAKCGLSVGHVTSRRLVCSGGRRRAVTAAGCLTGVLYMHDQSLNTVVRIVQRHDEGAG